MHIAKHAKVGDNTRRTSTDINFEKLMLFMGGKRVKRGEEKIDIGAKKEVS